MALHHTLVARARVWYSGLAAPVWPKGCAKVELDLDLFRTRGRAPVAVSAVQVRELGEDDLVLLGDERGTKAPPLKRLAERHHALARTLAQGTDPGVAAIQCGYSASRVSILQADPAFKELIEFYRADVTEKYLDLHSVLAGLSIDAAMELRERLEADIEADDKSISVGQLMELTKLGADRTGYGPQSSSTNLNINVDMASKLEAARKRVAARKTGVEDA